MDERGRIELLVERALPTFRQMGLQPARYDPATRRLSVSAHIGAEFADGAGVVRGGFLAALLDDVMTGAAILTFGDRAEPRLISQSVDYFMGVGPGEFTADGWVVSLNDVHCLTKAEVWGPAGVRVAMAQGVILNDAEG